MTSTASTIVRHGYALAALARLLTEASAWEFSTPPRRTHVTGEARPCGRISDATANIAMDDSRLALRSGLADAASAITSATVFLESATEALERALAPYNGEAPLYAEYAARPRLAA